MASKYAEFRFGWPVVFSSAVGIGLGMSPLPFYTLGVFAGPLAEEFGWGMGQIMASMAVFTFSAVFFSPIVGIITDKIGPRKVVLVSITLFSFAMMSFSLMQNSTVMWLGTWAVMAACGSGTLPIAWTRAVNSWFFEKRGLALGLALIGTGIFGIIAKQYAFFMIQLVGWRLAYVAVGALPLLIAWPIAFFLFRDASDPKVAEKASRMEVHTSKKHLNVGGLSLKQAAKDWRFWLLAYAFVPISFAVGGPIPNMETLLGSKGFDADDAVTLASLIGIAVIFGRVVGGYLLDHIWAPAVAATILSLPAIATWMLAQPDLSFAAAAIAILILGAAAGVEYDLMAYLVSRYFGMLHYAAIYGALYGFFALGAGIGPAVFGRSFEAIGSYDSILKVSSILFVIGAVPLLLLGKYRDYTQAPDESD
ncbi:MAG: MFS transporter [Woeseiaceae bacterium]|nr:MFS transporter [Woeseiaceae bacterium]